MVYNWITRRLGALLPQHCLGCTARSPRQRLCHDCFADLPWIGHACNVCGIPLDHTAQTCGECLLRPPQFDRCITPLRYEFPLPSLLTHFKQHRRHAHGAALADLLGSHLQAALAGNARPQCIVPVPLHPWKQALRGFNQAQLLATDVGRQLDIPVAATLVKRVRRAPPQHTLTARERQHNLQAAFAIDGDCSQLTHVAVLDDVVTTMATANTLAQLLKRHGIARVDVWALARTPRLQPR